MLSVSQYFFQYEPLSSCSSDISVQLVSPGLFPQGLSQNYSPSVSVMGPIPHTAKDITDHTHSSFQDLFSFHPWERVWKEEDPAVRLGCTLMASFFFLHGLCSLFSLVLSNLKILTLCKYFFIIIFYKPTISS